MGGLCDKELLVQTIEQPFSNNRYNSAIDGYIEVFNNIKNTKDTFIFSSDHNFIGQRRYYHDIIYIAKNSQENAIDSMLEEIKLNPLKKESYFRLAKLFKRQQKYEQMFSILLDCRKVIKDNNQVSLFTSQICKDITKDSKSLHYYEKMIQIQPTQKDHYASFIKLATQLQFEHWFPAEFCWIYLTKFQILYNSLNHEYRWLRGLILLRQNFIEEALNIFGKMFFAGEDICKEYEWVNNIYLCLTQPKRIFDYISNYLTFFPGQLKLFGLKAFYEFKLGMVARSEATVNLMINIFGALRSNKFVPFMLTVLAYSNQLAQFHRYAEYHLSIAETSKSVVGQYVVEALISSGNGIESVKYLKMMRQWQQGNYRVRTNLLLASQSLEIRDLQLCETIITEIRSRVKTLNYQYLAKFAILLYQARKYSQVLQLFQVKIIEGIQSVQIDTKVELYIYLMSLNTHWQKKSQSCRISEYLDSMSLQTMKQLHTNVIFLLTEMYVKAGDLGKAFIFYEILSDRVEKSVLLGFHWLKRQYENDLKAFRQLFMK